MSTDDKRIITTDEAKHLLADSPHSFVNPAGMLIGCDLSIERAHQKIDASERIELAGGQARAMGHGLVLWDGKRFEFLSTNKEKLDAFDPLGGAA